MPDKIYVPMPESAMYKKTVSRDELVGRYGESTVSRAEVATILNIMMISGMIKPNEFIDLMVRQCDRIDEERRVAARLDVDKG